MASALESLQGASIFRKLNLRNHLFVKAEEYEFHQDSVSFLGYIISAGGVQMDWGKVQAVEDCPQPISHRELQKFLDFANFYHWFIHNHSSIAAPPL